MKTKPLTPWKPRDPFSSSHLNEGWDSLRANQVSAGGAHTRTLPNGTIVSIPDTVPIQEGYIGVIYTQGPGGEADLTAETYWVWVQYVIANKWGTTVDIENDYPGTGSDLTNIIVPVTNECERQPGGAPDNGTHNLPAGMPVFFYAVKGRTTSATDTTAVQRYITFTPSGPGIGQYKYMYYGMVTQNKAGWDYLRANPMPGS